MHPLQSTSELIVYLDVKSPYALVAYGPTLALEVQLGLRFDWRPLTLNIPSYLGSATKREGQVVSSEGRSDRTWRAIRYSYLDARRYAERQGLVLKGTEKIWDSRLVNTAMLWVAEVARDRVASFLHAVYPPFWRRELDIEKIRVVEECLNNAGVTSSGFQAFFEGKGGALHDQLQASLHGNGIYGVPTYVLGGEVFHGREHLPYLRWALSGQKGPAPDIAYELGPVNRP